VRDFFIWIDREAPAWAFITTAFILIASFVLLFVMFILFYMWAASKGYWVLFAIPPAFGTWAVLNEYKKSKRN
jgi:hypothetical protein